jgi:hypothetical protein
MFLMCAFTFTIGSPIALRSARAPNDSIVAEGWPDCKSLKFLVPTLNAPDLIRMVRKTGDQSWRPRGGRSGEPIKDLDGQNPRAPNGEEFAASTEMVGARSFLSNSD